MPCEIAISIRKVLWYSQSRTTADVLIKCSLNKWATHYTFVKLFFLLAVAFHVSSNPQCWLSKNERTRIVQGHVCFVGQHHETNGQLIEKSGYVLLNELK